jgi:hypothetical protein
VSLPKASTVGYSTGDDDLATLQYRTGREAAKAPQQWNSVVNSEFSILLPYGNDY